jgi:hypothetical protein
MYRWIEAAANDKSWLVDGSTDHKQHDYLIRDVLLVESSSNLVHIIHTFFNNVHFQFYLIAIIQIQHRIKSSLYRN